jgi:glycosyltransferase involved in cell wall biosynthesis
MHLNHVLVSKELGGAGLTALGVATALHRRAQAIRVWIPGDGAAACEARRLGLDVRCYNPALISSSRSPLQTAIGCLGLLRSLRLGRDGLVHIHSPYVYRMLLPSLLLSRMRCVVHVQIEEDEETLRWAFRRPPELIVTCARFLIETVRRALPPRVQARQWIEAVPNAVDTRRFAPGDKQEAKERVGAPKDFPLALMLANLAPHKGQETAIRAVSILKQAGTQVHCWLAGIERGGATTYTDRLRALIAELGVSDLVRLLGQRDDVEFLLRASEFFLLPSTREGLPLSLLEAQACKVPVLAARTAGVPEIVTDGETGFLISADDAEGYAERIRLLLENPALYHGIAEQAHARAICESDWDCFSERIMMLYRALLERPRARAVSPADSGAFRAGRRRSWEIPAAAAGRTTVPLAAPVERLRTN